MRQCEGANCCYTKPSLFSLCRPSTIYCHVQSIVRKNGTTSRCVQTVRQSTNNEEQLGDIEEVADDGSTADLCDDE